MAICNILILIGILSIMDDLKTRGLDEALSQE